ncbi:aminoglycoside adenylyltransferase domain-containing protein [Planosporangium sp. 12N6]|uniref:aminoglycoside adenylyltransferase domain-containing protein n=1 Tax=Planosporangium spinosum TaxID=3402278 RepID=UPI003CFA2111
MTIRTPPAEAAYLTSVVDRLRAVLGGELVAVYPTGSLALDGYVPGRSDLDLIAVVDRPLPASALRTVASRLSHDELPCPAAGLEFVLYTRQAVGDGGVDAGYSLDLNTGRDLPPKMSLDPAEGPAFWYPIDRSITYQSDTALTGPAPRTVVRAAPFETLLPVVVESVLAHAAAVAEHGDNAVLNGCRALRFGAERRWYAKPAAARWTLDAAPPFRDLVESAIASHAAGRNGHPALPAADVTAFLGYVVERLVRGRTA